MLTTKYNINILILTYFFFQAETQPANSFQEFILTMAKSTRGRNKVLTYNQSAAICPIIKMAGHELRSILQAGKKDK